MLRKIGAVGGAIAVALCWPFATGQVGEQIYMDTVGKYENPYLAVTNDSYDRGYLGSEAVSRIEVKDEIKQIFEEEGLPTVWYVKHNITHDFMGISSTSEVEVDEALKPIADKLWGEGVAPATFVTSTALTRKTDFTFTINPIKTDNYNGGSADINAFVMQGTVDAKGAGEFSYQLPSASLTTIADETMVLKGLQGQGKGVIDGQFWIGDQQMSLDGVSFKDNTSDQSVDVESLSFAMNNVLSETTEDTQEPMLTNTNVVKVGKVIMLDGKEYSNFNFEMAFADLNYPALSRLGDLSDSMDGQLTAEEAERVSLALDLLVAKGMSFEVSDMSVTTPEGDIDSNIQLTLAPGIARISENIGQLPEKLSGEININLPVGLVEADPMLFERANMMVQNSIAEKSDTHYSLKMKVEGDKVVLASGDQLPLAMLFMLFM
ncbi:DUF945 domain-containing protein [Photobacterium sanctipauli]|uniref:DUF945 domain-containing protein n=1 Tax=Photobacterium sanctipauli TaxID=1342794 RepID=A0A2T3NNI0_9GAMM|nr:DUF945 family protein [Photobacterium sanctipauli]PSW17274.1 DUF945 domain-containing protein [Photobacterium sanctipauli]